MQTEKLPKEKKKKNEKINSLGPVQVLTNIVKNLAITSCT